MQSRSFIFLLSYTKSDDGLLQAETKTRSWVLYHQIEFVFEGYDSWFYSTLLPLERPNGKSCIDKNHHLLLD
jgi:hypothetical protein